MRAYKHTPIRMCIQCRERFAQDTLIRLQHNQGMIIPYSGQYRSFYVCGSCASKARTVNAIMGRYKIDKSAFERVSQTLKDSIVNG
ncbi:MAG: hypothetical protein KU28_00260 [Sulfurovum sp. PC08-66]|nr:MAG: hypothetical protein KU28_00260 [Sulfurovum sp. PC08-66]KIM12403.1 MAG: hypothetical protein KU37_00380 [Sulfuricurvum sp. PC08-66]